MYSDNGFKQLGKWSLSILILLLTAVTAEAQWTQDTSFVPQGDDLWFAIHGVAVDGEGKVWIQPFFATETIIAARDIGGDGIPDTLTTRAIYVYNPDGTAADFSPLKIIEYNDGSPADTLGQVWQGEIYESYSGRGLEADYNGDIIISQFNRLYKVDYTTGMGLAMVEPTAGCSLGEASSDADGNIYVGCVLAADSPIYRYNSNLENEEEIITLTESFSRDLQVSADGNTIWWAGWTLGSVLEYTRPDLFNPYPAVPDTILKGLKVENFDIHPVTKNLWVSSGSLNDVPEAPYKPQTWYAFDIADLGTGNEVPLDSIQWVAGEDISAGFDNARPRGLDFSSDGKIAYVGAFGGFDTDVGAQKFISDFDNNEPDNNIIVDGDFTGDALPLSWSYFQAESAVADFGVINNEATVTNISGAGVAAWHLQLDQIFTNDQIALLNTGELYTISFDARSSVEERPFKLFFGKTDVASTSLIEVDTVANTNMQNYKFDVFVDQVFTAMHLGFDLGLSNADFIVDNVSLKPATSTGSEVVFSATNIQTALGASVNLSVDLVETGSTSIESFQFELNYDPTLMDVIITDQSGTLAENFVVESNTETAGTILISAAGTAGITDLGKLFNFEVIGITEGEGTIEFTNIVYNETPISGFSSSVSVLEFICSDVTGDGNISAMDASYVLRHTVKLSPQYPLIGRDSLAADVTGNGWISAFDASQILKYNVGLPAIINCAASPAKVAPLVATISWDFTSTDSDESTIINVPLSIYKQDGNLTAAEIRFPISEGLTFKGINNLPENWQMTTNTIGKTVHISLYGTESLDRILLGELEFEMLDKTKPQSIEASVVVNENRPVKLDRLVLHEKPKEFELSQNYPNPFNPTTKINYSVPNASKVQLNVYNLLGQKVAELVNEQKSAGKYTVSWDASNISSGIYVYRFIAGEQTFTKKMMLIK